jgi:hypothetical protein
MVEPNLDSTVYSTYLAFEYGLIINRSVIQLNPRGREVLIDIRVDSNIIGVFLYDQLIPSPKGKDKGLTL